MRARYKHRLSWLATLCIVVAAPCVAGQSSGSNDIGPAVQRLLDVAAAHGVTVTDVKVKQSLDMTTDHGTAGTTSRCTVSATFKAPEQLRLRLAATTSTCADASRMLQKSIAQYEPTGSDKP